MILLKLVFEHTSLIIEVYSFKCMQKSYTVPLKLTKYGVGFFSPCICYHLEKKFSV